MYTQIPARVGVGYGAGLAAKRPLAPFPAANRDPMPLFALLWACLGSSVPVATPETPAAEKVPAAPVEPCDASADISGLAPLADRAQSNSAPTDAETLRVDGCRFDRAKDWVHAAEYFEAAVQAAPTPLNHFLLARAIANDRLAAPNNICDHESYADDVMMHLYAAHENANLMALAEQDPAFKALSGTGRYRAALGKPLGEGLTLFIVPVSGIYGNQTRVVLNAGGVAEVKVLSLDDAGNVSWPAHNGKWAVTETGLSLDTGEGPVLLTFQPTTGLYTDGITDRWAESASECEA